MARKSYKKVYQAKEGYKYERKDGKRIKVPPHSQHYHKKRSYKKMPRAKETPKKIVPIEASKLQPGDWIVIKTRKVDLVPGGYSHCAMYCGRVQSGEKIWDRDHKAWMPEGTPYVIHSTIKHSNGLGYSQWDYITTDVQKVRAVEVPDLSKAQKQKCVNYLKDQLTGGRDGYPVGPSYDIGWGSKQQHSEHYYCSEAIWDAYMSVHNIDLDPNGFNYNPSRLYGVAPGDLVKSKHSKLIKT